MDKTPFWSRFRLMAWFKGNTQARSERERRRRLRAGRRSFEPLEERDLFAVVVTENLSTINPDVAAIIITGSGFDPIVSNNQVTFNNSAVGTVTAASPTQLSVQFTTPPDDAGDLTAVVATSTENSGSPVKVATVVPKVTASLANLAANAPQIIIRGDGFDEIKENNTVAFTNGATGTVAAATDTQLTVTINQGPTEAGPLSVVVTTNTVASTSVQVATVVPVITSSNATLAANQATLTISGFGFSDTDANNSVDFDGMAVGNITAATPTSLTVTFTTLPRTAGPLTALVTSNTVTSAGAAVQVATVQPVITSSTTNLAANASSITINGYGFNPTASLNSVTFNNGAAGTIVSATPTTLVVNFTTKPTVAGLLTAQVTTNTVSSGAAVNVATVIPVVSLRTLSQPANASSMVINGFGFSTTLNENIITFNNGAQGTVTQASSTSLTVSIDTNPTIAGNLTAIVTTRSAASASAVQVATVTPVITSSNTAIAVDAATVTINGFGFDSVTMANNTVIMNNGAAGTVTAATSTTLEVTFGTAPTVAGNLTAVVTTGSLTSGTAVQIASVRPKITTSSASLNANASTITIAGQAFSPTIGNNSVSFNNGASGTITAATSTSLTVSFINKPTTAGSLTAVVTTNGVTSGAGIEVATVKPVVTANTAIIAADATSITIDGFGFHATPGSNTVTFNNGAVGSVDTATPTRLVVTLTTAPTAAGPMTAVVTIGGNNSGAGVLVANVRPVVTTSNSFLLANEATLVIAGTGFDTDEADNTVVFNNGAVGTVTDATDTALTVTFGTKPTSAGPLTAIVTTNGVASGTAVTVARVKPVVTNNTTSLAANATTVTIAGFGFDTTATDNLVTFNNSAQGVVTSATPTTLVVSFTTRPAMAGSLTLIVTTDTIDSGTAVQVANVIPAITPNPTGIITANASTIIINGYGFDPVAANNTVSFNNSATGTVTDATANQLTVSFVNKPSEAGLLTASVSTNTISSGANVSVAGVSPVVSANAASLLSANASQVLIVGQGFDTTAGNNTVVFDSGATGTVQTATATLLTVNLDNKPAAGNLKAIVTTNGINNGSAIQVATTRPVITTSASPLAANANTLTINGYGFDLTAANNTVTFNNGAVGQVTAATATTLTVTFSTKPSSAGSLTVVVQSNSVSSGPAIEVATVTPVVTSSTSSLAANESELIINGFGFDPTEENNTVSFNNGAIGDVTDATPTSLTITFSKKPRSAGSLTASITSNGQSSGANVQVATLSPVVTANAGNIIGANAAQVTITGQGFDPTPGNNTVVFNNGAVGTVDQATATSLTILLSTPPTSAGSLTAIVTSNGLDSGTAVQVATVVPVVTTSNANLLATAGTLTINGVGFSTTPASNLVSFNDGAQGTVTASTATSLTVTFSVKPTSADSLTVVVTTNGAASVAPVEVASVIPVITSSTTNLSAHEAYVIINGFGFSATPEDNTVTLNNGAEGTVTVASATSIRVTFSTPLETVGSLTARVVSNGRDSGSSVQVATVIPKVSQVTDQLRADSSTLIINGFAFDPVANHNTVVFNNGAVGTVTDATPTQLTVNLTTKPTTAGSLTAIVTTNSVSSGTAVQVATVVPVVTSTTTPRAANATTVTITGFGFSTTLASNTVAFNNGASGNVTAATPTSLTVTFVNKPTTAGVLTAVVTTGGNSSGSPVQVANITPVITSATTDLAASATGLFINGFGFSTVAEENVLQFNNGAFGIVTESTATRLTVEFSTKPTAGGPLTAIVTTGGVASGSHVQVAKVIPVVNSNAGLSLNANAGTVVINGIGFDQTASNNTVVFNNGATGTVDTATANTLTVTLNTKPTSAGSLTAIVTTNSAASGAAVQIATVAPVVTSAVTSLAINATTVTINGFGFSPTAGNNTVVFNNDAVGTVTTATATQLTVLLTTPPSAVGSLTAVVTSNTINSGSAVQVATVKPAVTINTTSTPINSNTITITGAGFDPTEEQNTVVFNNGAVGTVTTATADSLTVTLSVKPTTVGSLTATVTTNSQASSSTQVASIVPVVSNSTASRDATDGTLLIYGFGFDTTAANNKVLFSNGAAGVVSSASTTMLTVDYTSKPKAGNLTAQVIVNGVSNGSAVQVATVKPMVTSNTATLGANATTLTITGSGFDSTAANNLVTFNNGAIGTVTSATPTSLNVTLSTRPTTMGNLTVVVTTNTASSGTPVQVARVVPVVTAVTTNLALTANTLTITGFGFSNIAASNTVVFNNGAVGTVSSSNPTSLNVTFSTRPSAGNLTAVVTVNSTSSGTPVRVATLVPIVTLNSTTALASAGTINIAGSGFSTTAGNNTVVFSNGAVGTVTNATATLLTVTYSTRPWAGTLTATVTTNGAASAAPVQVATITPVVTASTTSLALNGTSLVINGFGFDPTRSNNTVTFVGGAAGSVSAATRTTLTVNFSTRPTATGTLNASVTTNARPSGTAVQVATVSANVTAPTITASTASLAANATEIIIAGTNFSTTLANNVVTFNNGAVGTVTAATSTQLTVAFSTAPKAGNLTATVAVSGVVNSGTIQVATVIPVVTSSTASQGAGTTTLTINGFGFDTSAGSNSVTLTGGAIGTVSAATATSLTINLTVRPTTMGSMTAVVTTNGKSSGAAVQVATVIPTITATTTAIAVNANTVTITGFGFSTTNGNNQVTFNNGAVGNVTTASTTSLTVTFSTKPTVAGNLTASVTIGGQSSGAGVQVAAVRPIVTSSTANVNINATTMTIAGSGFSTTAANNLVTFSNGAIGTVSSATATELTISFSNVPAAGNLTATVTTNGVSSGTAVQVARLTPTVSTSTANLGANSSTITITGTGFSPTASSNVVTFTGGAVGTVTAASPTSLTVNLTTRPTAAGTLSASVAVGGVSSGAAVQVATVIPVVTLNTTATAGSNNTITIAGFGFSTTPANNTVVFNNGATGTVTTASATSLIVTFGIKPIGLGSLTAVVTTNSASSGSPVQVATISPTVTRATANQSASLGTITILGTGFSTTAGNNTVVFSNGAVGTVQTATATSLLVNFSVKPSAGALTAIVTTSGVNSGTAVQIATITPSVTSSNAALTNSTPTLTINGSGFSTTLASNIVTFNNGATGTVTAATLTSLTVTIANRPSAGNLTAVVNTNGVSSGTAVQVASVPVTVTSSTTALNANASTVTITGTGFSTSAGSNQVVFNNGATGSVTAATKTQLTVTFNIKPTSAGSLTATVTTNGVSSGAAVQVANVKPVVTANTASLARTANTITITGAGFSGTALNNTVVFNNGATGTVTSATPTSLVVTFGTKPVNTGLLTAIITSNSVSSGTAIQVATMT